MAPRIWTKEQREKQKEAIKKWKPWEKSTGAKTPEGKAVVAKNAYKGGHRPMTQAMGKLLNKMLRDYEVILEYLERKQREDEKLG